MTLPDPRSRKYATDGQQGGTFEWRTETHDHPTFEIRFDGPNPVDEIPDRSFKGSDLSPVVLRLNNTGEFRYQVWQMDATDGVVKTGPFPFNVRPCRGCPP